MTSGRLTCQERRLIEVTKKSKKSVKTRKKLYVFWGGKATESIFGWTPKGAFSFPSALLFLCI
jgi:hypothetical protein